MKFLFQIMFSLLLACHAWPCPAEGARVALMPSGDWQTGRPAGSLAAQYVSKYNASESNGTLTDKGVTNKDSMPFVTALVSDAPSALTDVLFSYLSQSLTATFVDREELARLAEETNLMTLAGQDPIGLGSLVKADAVIIARQIDQFLFVRIVETVRGQSLYSAVDEATVDGARNLASLLLLHIEHRRALFRLNPEDRQYLTIERFEVHPPRSQAPIFDVLEDLLSVQMAAIPEVVVLERKALPAIDFERSPIVETGSTPLATADWLLRGVRDGDTERITVRLQLQTVGGENKWVSDDFDLSPDGVRDALPDMIAWAVQTMQTGLQAQENEAILSTEAAARYLLGQMYQAREQPHFAIEQFRIASVFSPTNRDYVWALANALANAPGDRFTRMSHMTEAMDICQFVLNTDSVPFKWGRKRWNREPSLPFLGSLSSWADEAEKAVVVRFKHRLRDYLEYANLWNPEIAMFWFDTPEEAIAYLKEIDYEENLSPWRSGLGQTFLAVPHWDAVRAQQSLIAYLEDICTRRDDHSKYAALMILTHLHGGFGENPTKNGKAAVRNLFTWLGENPDERHKHIIPGLISRFLWPGFSHMDLSFQRENIGPLMMPRVFECPNYDGVEDAQWAISAYARLQAAYPDDQDLKIESTHYLNRILERYSPERSAINMNARERILTFLEREHPGLIMHVRPELAMDIDHVVFSGREWPLVFNFIDDVPDAYLTAFKSRVNTGFLGDPGYLWLTWFNTRTFWVLAQFNLHSQTTQFFVNRNSTRPRDLVYWRGRLFLVRMREIHYVDYDKTNGIPRLESPKPIKGIPDGAEITCIVPGRDAIYIGTTPGAIYRWAPSNKVAEKLVHSETLTSGPLNDKSPYSVDKGHLDPETGSIDFHITPQLAEPRKGWWRYRSDRKPPWQWRAETGIGTPINLPGWRVDFPLGMHTADLQFIPQYGAPIHVARASGLLRSSVHWNDNAVIWIIHNVVPYNCKLPKSRVKVYMLERQYWPDREPR